MASKVITMYGINLDLQRNNGAFIYCSDSVIGALVFVYNNTYYNGVLSTQLLKNGHWYHYENEAKALATDFEPSLQPRTFISLI